jgi:uncharacterized protein
MITPVHASHDGVDLAGSVWLPATQPRGLLLMHPGSGPSDRDNDVLFPPIREALLETGVAVCSFDKRGVGGSSGHWYEADIDMQAADLACALDAARRVVPDGPVGLFGHSQGGWVVLSAARRTAADFVITNSGPSVSPLVQEEYSTGTRLRAAGLPAPEVEAGVSTFRELMELALAGAGFDRAREWMTAPEHAGQVAVLTEVGAFVPDSEAEWQLAASLVGHDPEPALTGFRVPLLAVLGAADGVVPVELSAERYRDCVRPELLQVEIVADGDHRMQLPGTDRFAPGYLAILTGFVAARVADPFSCR